MNLRSVALLALTAATAACANRGMKAPTDGGRDLTSGDGADGARDTSADTGPTCTGPVIMTDGGTGDARDGGDAGSPCQTRFNFEGGQLHGATLVGMSTAQAFPSLANGGCRTYCGGGALELTANFFEPPDGGTGGPGVTGQVLIPLAAGGEDLSNATITIRAIADPPDPKRDLKLYLVLLTSAGSENAPGFPYTFESGQWVTATTRLGTAADGGPVDSGVRGASSVTQLALEFFSYQNYKGKIYVDEIDIR